MTDTDQTKPLHLHTPTATSHTDVDPRLAPVIEDVTARLHGVCAHMELGEFNRLVLDIARLKLRWSDEPRRE